MLCEDALVWWAIDGGVPVFVSGWMWRSVSHQRQGHLSCVSGVVKLRIECPHAPHHMQWYVCTASHNTHTQDGARNTPHTHSGWSKEHTTHTLRMEQGTHHTHTRDGARNTPHTQGLQYTSAHRSLVSPSQAASSTAATQHCCVPTLRYQRG